MPALKGNRIKDIPPPHTPSCLHIVLGFSDKAAQALEVKLQKIKNFTAPLARNNPEPKEIHRTADPLPYNLIIIIKHH